MKTTINATIDIDVKRAIYTRYPNQVSKIIEDFFKDLLGNAKVVEEENKEELMKQKALIESKIKILEEAKIQREQYELKKSLSDEEIKWIGFNGKNIFNKYGFRRSFNDFKEHHSRKDFPKDAYIEELKKAGVEVTE